MAQTSTPAAKKNGNGHEKKTMTIVINAQEKVTSSPELTFEDVVSLAYDGSPPTGDNWVFTVTYRRGQGNKPEGSLIAGEAVKIKDGMVFNVSATDKS